MFEPFSDNHDKSGMLMHPPEELYRRMSEAHNAGWQVCIHAIGDAANDLCVELYARLFKENPRKGCRHRIEHASIMDEKTMRELSRLGIVVSTQPMFIHSEKDWLRRRLGDERCKIVYPFRSFLDAKIKVAGAGESKFGRITAIGQTRFVFRLRDQQFRFMKRKPQRRFIAAGGTHDCGFVVYFHRADSSIRRRRFRRA